MSRAGQFEHLLKMNLQVESTFYTMRWLSPFLSVPATVFIGLMTRWLWALLFYLAWTLFMGLVDMLYYRAWDRHQFLLDTRASRIVSTVLRGEETSPFSIFLRPFQVDGGLTSTASKRFSRKDPFLFVLEPQIAISMEHVAPLITVKPDAPETFLLGEVLQDNEIEARAGAYGGGRVKIEPETWKRTVGDLLSAAEVVFMVPSDSDGCLWEIGKIQTSGLLEKVIFVMPTVFARGYSPEEWERAKRAWADLGMHLPAQERHGLFFTMGPDGQVGPSCWYTDSRWRIRRAVRRLLGHRKTSANQALHLTRPVPSASQIERVRGPGR